MKFCKNSYGNPEDMDKNNNNYAKISGKNRKKVVKFQRNPGSVPNFTQSNANLLPTLPQNYK